jgi:hypothetical protein
MDVEQENRELPPGQRPLHPPEGPEGGGGRHLVATWRRAAATGVILVLALCAGVWLSGARAPAPGPRRGSTAWATLHYGDPDSPGFRRRRIVEIEFLGRSMFVHRWARRHFLRLEQIFEARAPEYAAAVSLGELDDWSYRNRNVRGGESKSKHAFGLAIDVNALTNPLGGAGDMPREVVDRWEAEGGEWGGDWSRPDPMHFETLLQPDEIRRRYSRDGSPRPGYLEELSMRPRPPRGAHA